MTFIQPLGQLRSPVATYSALPLTENVKGDIRLTLDIGSVYTWIANESNGTWVDWKKITISNYNDLSTHPSTSPLAIDDAILAIRSLFLNYILLFFQSAIAYGITVMKMIDGLIDMFRDISTVDLNKLEHSRYLKANGEIGFDYFYIPNFDGTLDEYTKLLIPASYSHNQIFFDELRNQINPNTVGYDNGLADAGALKFHDKSFKFLGLSGDYLSVSSINENGSINDVNNIDFSFDAQVRFHSSSLGIKTPLFSQGNGSFFMIQKNELDKIYVKFCGTSSYNDGKPVDPIYYDVEGTSSLVANQWYHIAIQRRSGTIEIYIDGDLDGTSLIYDNQNIAHELPLPALKIGDGFIGWMDEIRYSKGVVRYNGSFISPDKAYNTPLESTMDYKRLLIHADGENNSTAFIDSSVTEKPIASFGNAHVDTAEKKFGTGSIKLDGTTGYLSVENSQDFDLYYLRHFTFDAWIRTENNSKDYQYLFSRRGSSSNNYSFLYNGTGKFHWHDISDFGGLMYRTVDATYTLENNTWYHIALVRKAGEWFFFVNGVSIPVTVYQNHILPPSVHPEPTDFIIGSNLIEPEYNWQGNIDEFRFCLDKAVWESSFTPSIEPYLSYIKQPSVNNMIVQSNGFEANSIPTSARVVLFEEDDILGHDILRYDTIFPNRDIKIYISRDGGTTFTQTLLSRELDIMSETYTEMLKSKVNFYVGTVDLSSQPNGKTIVYKITSHNNRRLLLRSIAVNWK